jgi:hypothetical protein
LPIKTKNKENNVKKLVFSLGIFCLAISSVFGMNQDDQEVYENTKKEEVRSKFSYLRLDYGIPGAFGLNCGKRGQLNHNGFDISVGSWVLFPQLASVNLDINYLFYLNPNHKKQWYLGLGLKNVFVAFDAYKYVNLPIFTLGREYLNKERKRFLELKIGFYGLYKDMEYYNRSYYYLSRHSEKGIFKYPFVYISHGIEF